MAQSPMAAIVNWFDNERVDIVDLQRVQTLIYTAITEVLGSFAGRHSSGLLTRPRFGVSGAVVTPIPFRALYVPDDEDDLGLPGVGVPVTYDRRLPWQEANSTTSVNLTGYSGRKPYIWARREEVEWDTEARVAWDDGTDDEVVVPDHNTVIRDYCLLGLSDLAGDDDDPPDDSEGWFKIARVVSTSPVSIWPRYAWEEPDGVAENYLTAGTAQPGVIARAKAMGAYGTVDTVGGGIVQRNVGFGGLFTQIFAALSREVDDRWSVDQSGRFTGDPPTGDEVGWLESLTGTTPGRVQLKEAADSLLSRFNALVTKWSLRCCVLYAARIAANGTKSYETGELIELGLITPPTVNKAGDGTYNITFITTLHDPPTVSAVAVANVEDAADSRSHARAFWTSAMNLGVLTYEDGGDNADRAFSVIIVGRSAILDPI